MWTGGLDIDTDRPMDNIPTEGSPAGDALAAMLVVAPFFAIVIGSLVRPPLLAFFMGVLAGVTVIIIGTRYAFSVAPGSGTVTGAYFFGSAAALLSLMMATLTTVTRAMHKSQKDKDARAAASGV